MGRIVRTVICAACRNKTDGITVLSARHFDSGMHEQLNKMYPNGYGFGDGFEWQQGFIDQWCKFMTREEAYIVAKNAGQLKGKRKSDYKGSIVLYTEDIY